MFEVRIAATDPPPERYRWQIVNVKDQTVIEAAAVSFRREQTAREAGQRALERFLKEIAGLATG